MTAPSPAPASTAPTPWAPRFFLIWTGQAISLIGSALVQFAIVWWLTVESGGSATVLSRATLFALLPQVLLGPFTGALVDRWNRRLIMIVADSFIALLTLGLVFLFASDAIRIWHIYAAMFLRSLGGAFHHPAMTSSTSLMVPKEQLTRIAGLNQLLGGLLSIAAPPLGALLISLMQTENVLLIDVGTAALAVLPLLLVSIPQPPRQIAQANGTATKTTYWYDLREGFSYVVRWKGLFGLILLAMALNFVLSPASSLLPVLVAKVFNGNAARLAAAESVFGFGVILGGLVLSAWGGFKRRIVTSFTGIVGIGVGVILNGLAPVGMFSLVLAAGFILGFMQVIANGPLGAIFQSAIDPDMQGRVFSLIGAGATAMMPISLLIAGPLADWLGVRFVYIAGGTICILMVLWASTNRQIMEIEQNRQPAAAAIPAPPANPAG